MAAHPGLLRESQYRLIVHEEVWELKHAYRETCLCRSCFNMRCYREALKVVHKILVLIMQRAQDASAPDESELSGAGEEESGVGDTLLGAQHSTLETHSKRVERLLDFCEGADAQRREKLTRLVCANSDSFNHVTARCVRGECLKCGFSQLWSRSLKKDLVDARGELKAGVSKVWVQDIEWSRIKTGGDGSSSEDELRQHRSGTVIQFLDEFEPVQQQHLRHSFHIDQCKDAEADFSCNSIPGVIDCKSDWSENGSLEKKRQMQSEYWVIVHYSLLISIASFLVSSAWLDRTSILPVGAEVTVEPADYAPTREGKIQAVEGSFWARVERCANNEGTTVEYADGEGVSYVVRSLDGQLQTVPRSQLRHRRRHRIAFVQVTNDKKHDFYSSSAFATRRQDFFQKWHQCGHAAAIEWACNDTAERERLNAMASATAAASITTTADDCDGARAVATVDVDTNDPAVAAAKAVTAATRKLTAGTARLPRPRLTPKRAPQEVEFEQWLQKLEQEKFWGWLEDTDNATHFKSKEMLYYWSQRMEETEFLRIVWVEFGCPGHGKGPWDGLGAMVKTKVARDLTNEQCLTPSHNIDSALEVAQHTRATFCTKVCLMRLLCVHVTIMRSCRKAVES